MTTLLIDGDVLAYEAAFICEKAVEWEPDEWTISVDAAEVRADVDRRIAALKDHLEATKVVVALTDAVNFRKAIYPAYKGNRARVRKPVGLKPTRQYLLDQYKAFVRPGLEGDDVLGILATNSKIVTGRKIIVSIDKDMRCIPGLLFNDGHPLAGVQRVSLDEADLWHLTQTLTGDTTDGYPGCPGVGPVKAKAILAGDPQDRWAAVEAAFVKVGLTTEDALVQARVARILRNSDYDFDKKEPILWTPPC